MPESTTAKTNRPEYASYGIIYFIRHLSGSYKIGITLDWNRRSKELKVGSNCREILVAQIEDPGHLEKVILRKYSKYNLPGSEWLNLKSEHVDEIKTMIEAGSGAYKQVFNSRDNKMIDLEIALQEEPELLERFDNLQSKTRRKENDKGIKKKQNNLRQLIIFLICLIPPVFLVLIIIELVMALSGQGSFWKKLFE